MTVLDAKWMCSGGLHRSDGLWLKCLSKGDLDRHWNSSRRGLQSFPAELVTETAPGASIRQRLEFSTNEPHTKRE